MIKSIREIKKMRSRIIEFSISIENMLDGIINKTSQTKRSLNFCKKIEIIRRMENGKYGELANNLDKLRKIRNKFAHEPTGGSTRPTLMPRDAESIDAKKEFDEFDNLHMKCSEGLNEIIKNKISKNMVSYNPPK